jgi:prephenate dehydrogenase
MDGEPGFGKFNLSDLHVTVIGLGLMGGSLAMALRGKCAYLTGVEIHPGTLSKVKKSGVLNCVEAFPGESASQADLIILATPVAATINIVRDLPDLHPGPAVVLDLASTKRLVLRAMNALPPRFDPIGGHPMCGKEILSFDNAEASLYREAPFALTRLDRTTNRACGLAEQLCETIGAHPVWLGADTHDAWVAATSHLPYLLASALAFITPEEAAPLVGPGFRSTTRLSATPIAMMRDILFSNQDNMLGMLRRLRSHIDLLEVCLATGDFAQMEQLLEQGAERRQRLLSGDYDGAGN